MDARTRKMLKQVYKDVQKALTKLGWKAKTDDQTLQAAIDNGSLIGKPIVVVRMVMNHVPTIEKKIVQISSVDLQDKPSKELCYQGYACFTLDGETHVAYVREANAGEWYIASYERELKTPLCEPSTPPERQVGGL